LGGGKGASRRKLEVSRTSQREAAGWEICIYLPMQCHEKLCDAMSMCCNECSSGVWDTVREGKPSEASGRRDGNCIRAERRLALLVIISFMYAWVRTASSAVWTYEGTVHRFAFKQWGTATARRHGSVLPRYVPDLLTDCLISNPPGGERRRLVFIYAHGTRRPAHLSSCIFRFRGGLEGRGAGVPRGVEGSQLRPCASRRCRCRSLARLHKPASPERHQPHFTISCHCM
jgi:hypothetical protein